MSYGQNLRLTSFTAAVLLLAGCGSSDGEVTHPIDAAERLLHALGEQDEEAVCDLLADPEEGLLADDVREDCERGAGRLMSSMSDRELEALREARIATVTLVGGEAARVVVEDYETEPLRVPRLELIGSDGQWYVQDFSFD